MTKNLHRLQENLQAYLLTGNSAIAKDIVNPAQDTVDTRLAIYRDSYYLCLLNILRKDFSLLEQVLGEQAFEEVGLAYINAYPSQYFTVNNFALRFPVFLQSVSSYNKYLYLSELAEFIWALNNTLISADAAILTVNDLAQIPPNKWENLQLKMHPSVKLMIQQTNAYEIWQALQQAKPLPEAVKLTQANHCLVWRKDFMPFSSLLTQETAWIIKSLQEDQPFAEICEGLTQWLPEEAVAQYAVNHLINWLNQGLFVAFHF